jgi:hypothetical protein
MPIDASIYQNFLRPPKSMQEYDNEAMAAQGNALQLQTQRMQANALMQQQAEERGLRNFLAGGADLSTPEGAAGLFRAAPKAAGGILKSQAEIAQANQAALKDKAQAGKASAEQIGEAIKNSRLQLDGVTTPEQYIAWHMQNHADPVLGAYLDSRGVTVDSARAQIDDALKKPGGFVQLLNESKMGAEKTYAQVMSEKTLAETNRHNTTSEGLTKRGQDVGAETTRRGQNMADQRARDALVQGDRHFTATQAGKGAQGTEGERNAAGYLMRMEEATKLLDKFEAKGAATYGTQAAGGLPLVGNMARRLAMSPEQQQYRQAQEDWVRSKLRKESGASIASDEMDREIETYFPMPGEGKEVIAQKRQARGVANEAMRQSAGRASQPAPVAAKPGVGVIDFGSLK